MKTYFIHTFGCQLNFADSERIATALEIQGYKKAKNIKDADLIIINSCIVRQSAENRVYGLINQLSRKESKVILTGCLAGWALRSKNHKNLSLLKKRIGNKVEIKLIENLADFDVKAKRNKNNEIAYIPISNGCNNFCSYCIVPYARGQETYRSSEEIQKDIHCALKQGFSQIMLLGQNVNSWKEKKQNFPVLLNKIAQNKKIKKLSFMSANPKDFSDELINVIAQNKNISREIHLPLQSGDDEILKKMNRKYTAKNYLSLVKKIKSKIPNAKFTTDILIGFPGETDEQFQNTVNLCKKIGFKQAFLNKYSPRPGTLADQKYEDNIPMRVKKQRWELLEKLINKI